jgi:hypothetical protein
MLMEVLLLSEWYLFLDQLLAVLSRIGGQGLAVDWSFVRGFGPSLRNRNSRWLESKLLLMNCRHGAIGLRDYSSSPHRATPGGICGRLDRHLPGLALKALPFWGYIEEIEG